MGKIDSRLRQGKSKPELLGDVSCLCVGDPGQCAAQHDQQLYDIDRHPNISGDSATSAPVHSNVGLEVYRSFTDCIILTSVYRFHTLQKENLTKEEEEYNARGRRWMEVLHRLRDLDLTLEDYYWLCKRKRSMLPLTERREFQDHPIIMDYRRETETNPENNATFYNRRKLHAHAARESIPVARFDATHTGIEQDNGMKLKPELFQNLDSTLELAKGALVLITANLAVEHGIMNGTRGIIREILYTDEEGPRHTNIQDRMPHTILIECPDYSGPSFFDTGKYPERRTWIPLRPREQAST